MSSLFALGGKETEKRIRPKPVDNKQKWLALAPFLKKRFKTNMTTKEIAAELSYQEYLKQREKDIQWERFSEVI